jgi:MtfA peptidase
MYKWLKSILPTLRPGDKLAKSWVSQQWPELIAAYPFLRLLDPTEQFRLEALALQFLEQKEFHGAHGLVVTDTMALTIAAQACLVVLNIAPERQALAWYDDFVGIVVHPAEMLARREVVDETGVVHYYKEALSGEAMQGGPITLNWQDISNAGQTAVQGMNLVIHEFAHKIDMRSGQADGCPPLPNGFMGAATEKQARQIWQASMQSAYGSFREQAILAERFGQPAPWLDAYGASSPAEFFAVACEAYFVNRDRFTQEFQALMPMFDDFFVRTQKAQNQKGAKR